MQVACQSWAAASACSEVTSVSKAWEEVGSEQAKSEGHNK